LQDLERSNAAAAASLTRLAENEVIYHDTTGFNEWYLLTYRARGTQALVTALDGHMQAFDEQSGERYYRQVCTTLRRLSKSLEMDLGRPTAGEQNKAFAQLAKDVQAASTAVAGAIEQRRALTAAAAELENDFAGRSLD